MAAVLERWLPFAYRWRGGVQYLSYVPHRGGGLPGNLFSGFRHWVVIAAWAGACIEMLCAGARRACGMGIFSFIPGS